MNSCPDSTPGTSHTSCFELEILADISKIANSDTGLTERLKSIISIIKERAGVDACSILLLDDDREHLVLKATIGLNESMINVLCMSLDTGIAGWTAKEKKPVRASDASEDYRFLPVPETGEGLFKSTLSVPLIANHVSIGVIYAQTIERREFLEGEVKLLSLIADQVAGIIRNAQLYEKSRQNLSELLLINEITQAINTTFDLDKLLSLIVMRSTEVVQAKACGVWITADESLLVPRASFGMDQELFKSYNIEIGSQVIGEAAEFSEPRLVRDISSCPDGSFLKKVCEYSALIVPLTVESKVIGVLVLMDKLSSVKGKYCHFLPYDQNVISLLGGQVALAIDKAVLYEKLERVSREREAKIQELLLLYDISVAMQSTVSLNKIIRIILSCVTVGDLFAFNRAILFLFDQKTHMLNGMMGMGPDGAEEAARVWQSIPKIENLVNWLLSQEDGPLESGKYFDQFARELKIHISRDGSILAQALLEGKHFNIKSAHGDSRVNMVLKEKLGADSFAVVPIIAQEQTLGVILVDNLYSGKDISDDAVHSLVRFISHVGHALQNIKLFARLTNANKEILKVQNHLIQAEKLSALGDLTAELAHELKNPMMIIGGFSRRLTAGENLAEEEVVKYSEIITREVERTETILNKILTHSRFFPVNFALLDINGLLKESLSVYALPFSEKGIEVSETYGEDLEEIEADSKQIKQVIINLIHNAMDALPDGGLLSVKTEPAVHSGKPGVLISVQDNGKGIEKDVIKDLFNPFFSTKEGGSGLGLHLSKKIIKAHLGTIEIGERDSGGTIIDIFLPFKSEELHKIQDGGGE